MTPAELEQMRRLIREEARAAAREESDRRAKPLEQRADKHSGEFREMRADSRRERSESQHDIEDQIHGFERLMVGVVKRIEEKVDTVVKSIPPAAEASKGAELAAVAGAQSAIRVEGKTDAVQVAANRADTNSLAAKVGAHRALIAQIVTAIALAVWQLYEHFAGAK